MTNIFEYYITTYSSQWLHTQLTFYSHMTGYMIASSLITLIVLCIGFVINHLVGDGEWKYLFTVITSVINFAAMFMVDDIITSAVSVMDFNMIIIAVISIIPAWLIMIAGLLLLFKLG